MTLDVSPKLVGCGKSPRAAIEGALKQGREEGGKEEEEVLVTTRKLYNWGQYNSISGYDVKDKHFWDPGKITHRQYDTLIWAHYKLYRELQVPYQVVMQR